MSLGVKEHVRQPEQFTFIIYFSQNFSTVALTTSCMWIWLKKFNNSKNSTKNSNCTHWAVYRFKHQLFLCFCGQRSPPISLMILVIKVLINTSVWKASCFKLRDRKHHCMTFASRNLESSASQDVSSAITRVSVRNRSKTFSKQELSPE